MDPPQTHNSTGRGIRGGRGGRGRGRCAQGTTRHSSSFHHSPTLLAPLAGPSHQPQWSQYQASQFEDGKGTSDSTQQSQAEISERVVEKKRKDKVYRITDQRECSMSHSAPSEATSPATVEGTLADVIRRLERVENVFTDIKQLETQLRSQHEQMTQYLMSMRTTMRTMTEEMKIFFKQYNRTFFSGLPPQQPPTWQPPPPSKSSQHSQQSAHLPSGNGEKGFDKGKGNRLL